MKGETGYLLPYGCAHAPMAYKWHFGGCVYYYFHQQIARDFPISTSPCNTIKMFQAENTVTIINLITL